MNALVLFRDLRAPTCRELDGCCLVHSPCFEPVHVADPDPDRSYCDGWPCPEGTMHELRRLLLVTMIVLCFGIVLLVSSIVLAFAPRA